MNYLALNGQILAEPDARLSPLDRGFLYGDGLFETIKASGAHIYFLPKHLERLRDGAAFLKIPFPRDVDYHGLILELMERNRVQDGAGVKICLSRGLHEGPIELYEPTGQPTLLIVVRPHAEPDADTWAKGVDLTVEREVLQTANAALAQRKCLNYLFYLLVRTRAREKGFIDGIIINHKGHVCECATANLFFFRDGRLQTPACSCGLLPGILRAALMDCLARDGEPIDEVELTPDALKQCDEVFITNSLMELLPVARVDERRFDQRDQTRRLLERFRTYRDRLHRPGENE